MWTAFVLLPVLSHAARISAVNLSSGPSTWRLATSCEIVTQSSSLVDWLDAAAHLDAATAVCENYGSVFGFWADAVCPLSLSDVADAVHQQTSVASGGRSGKKVILTDKYVIKVIDEQEKLQLERLMNDLRTIQSSDSLSFIVPTCRLVKIGETGEHMTVMPNVMLRNHLGSTTFDLKGNWDYSARMAPWTEGVLKDGNFRAFFPEGMEVEKMRFKGQMYDANAAMPLLFDALNTDVKALANLGLMDYSLLLDVTDLCPYRILVETEKLLGNISEGRIGKRYQLTPFSKTVRAAPRQNNGGRPIYFNGVEYLYYWAPHKEWQIGFDPSTTRRGIAASSQAGCPNEANKWYVNVGVENMAGRDEEVDAKGWSSEHGLTVKDGDTPSHAQKDAALRMDNPDLPMVWVKANGMQHVMTISLIDMFMHEDNRGVGNVLGSAVTAAWCTPGDIDPIAAKEYRVRFMRMLGYKDPDYKYWGPDVCGSCLASNMITVRSEYTYFTSNFQRSQAGACEWA